MSTLKEKIVSDFMEAFKNKETLKKNILGSVKSKITVLEKTQPVTDNDILALIQKEINQLQSTIDFTGIKEELKLQAIEEKKILEIYLPEQMTEEEVKSEIEAMINSGQVEKNMGSVMKMAKEKYQGKFDMSKLSALVKAMI